MPARPHLSQAAAPQLKLRHTRLRKNSIMKWTPELEELLLDELLNQTNLGLRADSGWHKDAWDVVSATVSHSYGRPVTKDQCKNKQQWYKRLYVQWEILRDLSGWGWDEERQLFIQTDEIWDEYLSHKSHEMAKYLRYDPLPYKETLERLFARAAATGVYAKLSITRRRNLNTGLAALAEGGEFDNSGGEEDSTAQENLCPNRDLGQRSIRQQKIMQESQSEDL